MELSRSRVSEILQFHLQDMKLEDKIMEDLLDADEEE
jgi:hypothetical protein